MDAVSVPKMLVASNVHVPASISCKALMMRFPSVKAKRGSSKDTYIPVDFFNFTSGLGIPEMVQLMETWNPTVRFLEGRMGPTVNWGGSREMENRNYSRNSVDCGHVSSPVSGYKSVLSAILLLCLRTINPFA